MPDFLLIAFSSFFLLSDENPNSLVLSKNMSMERILITIFSPVMVGTDDILKSMPGKLSYFIDPSWGILFWDKSMPQLSFIFDVSLSRFSLFIIMISIRAPSILSLILPNSSSGWI